MQKALQQQGGQQGEPSAAQISMGWHKAKLVLARKSLHSIFYPILSFFHFSDFISFFCPIFTLFQIYLTKL
jgi:hypothetical protein